MAPESRPPTSAPRDPTVIVVAKAKTLLRARRYSPRTVEAYVLWIQRFLRFHAGRPPASLGDSDVTDFLTSLAMDWRVAAATQNQALSALLFLFSEVLGRGLTVQGGIVRARGPKRLPVVLSRDEVKAVLERMDGVSRLMGTLLGTTGEGKKGYRR